jgi:hypothetical protein
MNRIFLLLSLCLFSSNGFSAIENQSSYYGHYRPLSPDAPSIQAILSVKSLAGRPGSFVAFLRTENEAALYLMDPAQDASISYVLIPLRMTIDGDIGAPNNNPTYIIQNGRDEAGRNCFNIIAAGSKVPTRFDGTFQIGDKRYDSNWNNSQIGTYNLRGSHLGVNVSEYNSKERQTALSFNLADWRGPYLLKKRWPAIYKVEQRSYTNSGIMAEGTSIGIGLFFHDWSWDEHRQQWNATHKFVVLDGKSTNFLKTFYKR